MCWRSVESHHDDGSDEGVDFDLCEDCLRWVIYCAESGTDLGAHEDRLRKIGEDNENKVE